MYQDSHDTGRAPSKRFVSLVAALLGFRRNNETFSPALADDRGVTAQLTLEPFRIAIPDADLADLKTGGRDPLARTVARHTLAARGAR